MTNTNKGEAQTQSRSNNKILLYFAIILFIIVSTIGFFVVLMDDNNKIRGLMELDSYNTLEFLSDNQIATDSISDKDKNDYRPSQPQAPRFLTIDKLGVYQARVMPIGTIQKTNQIDAPRNIYDIGWFNNTGEQFGIVGHTDLLVGHSCTNLSYKCAFNNIEKLKNGDIFKIELAGGAVLEYEVDYIDVIHIEEIDMDEVLAPRYDDKASISLITCMGYWTARDWRGHRSTSHRVVVYGSLKDSRE